MSFWNLWLLIGGIGTAIELGAIVYCTCKYQDFEHPIHVNKAWQTLLVLGTCIALGPIQVAFMANALYGQSRRIK